MAQAVPVSFLLAGIRDASGEPLASGKVHTYETGTTTDKDTYTAQDQSATATNPIILDSNGRAQIYATGFYKFVIKTSADATLYTWDNLYFPAEEPTYGGTATGSSNAYAITPSPAVQAYAAGQRFVWFSNHTNSGAPTLNVSGLGAKNIKISDGATAVPTNLIVSGDIVEVYYDGTNFILLQPVFSAWQTWTPTFGAGGALTWSPSSATYARYRREGKTVEFVIAATATSGGADANSVTFTLPSTPTSNATPRGFGGYVVEVATAYAASTQWSSGTTVNAYKYDGSNYTAGNVIAIRMFGTYEEA